MFGMKQQKKVISEGVNEHLAEGVVTNLSDITTGQLPELCPLAPKVCEVKGGKAR